MAERVRAIDSAASSTEGADNTEGAGATDEAAEGPPERGIGPLREDTAEGMEKGMVILVWQRGLVPALKEGCSSYRPRRGIVATKGERGELERDVISIV